MTIYNNPTPPTNEALIDHKVAIALFVEETGSEPVEAQTFLEFTKYNYQDAKDLYFSAPVPACGWKTIALCF